MVSRISFRHLSWRTTYQALRDGMRRQPWTMTLVLLSWAYLVAVCVIAALMWGWGDRWWVATVLLFIGRWIFLLPLVVLVPAALVLRRSMLVPLVIGGLIVLGPIMGARTGWRRMLSSPEGVPLRVVTFNADGGEPIATQLAQLIADWHPDIIAFQECGAELASATQRVPGWHAHHVRALCLLTKYPIREAQVMDRSALERVNADEIAAIGGSGDVVRYTLETPHGPIAFTNVHLETPRKGLEELLNGSFNLHRLRLNTELRDIESKLARDWVDRSAAPVLVAGDFNTPVESRIFRAHWGDLRDAFSEIGSGLGMSKYNGWIRVRIDHVLLGPEWHATRVAVGDDLGSDHRPVIVDVTWAGDRLP